MGPLVVNVDVHLQCVRGRRASVLELIRTASALQVMAPPISPSASHFSTQVSYVSCDDHDNSPTPLETVAAADARKVLLPWTRTDL